MKIKLLPSTFDADGVASLEQRLSCFLIDDLVAIDGGSIALALTDTERDAVRDIIVTHPHMDHIATLPIFIDDLFGKLREAVRVHATKEVIRLLERDVFNGTVYPPFHEFNNGHTRVLEFVPFKVGEQFRVGHLDIVAVPVQHIVPTVGLIISDGATTLAFSSDTASTDDFWKLANDTPKVDALLIEASFPNAYAKLAEVSGHLTPGALGCELKKLKHQNVEVLVVHLKPSFRQQLIEELDALGVPRLSAMEAGREYSWN